MKARSANQLLLFNDTQNSGCTRCPLHKNSKNVCLWGSGNPNAKLLFVFGTVGWSEDAKNSILEGKLGKDITKAATELGILGEIYITSAIKCRPGKNSIISQQEKDACTPYLEYETRDIPAQIVVPVGAVAKAVCEKSFLSSRVIVPLQNFSGNYPALKLEIQRLWNTANNHSTTYGDTVYLLKSKEDITPNIVGDILNASLLSVDIETNAEDGWSPEYRTFMVGIAPSKEYTYVFHGEEAIRESVRILKAADEKGVCIGGHNVIRFDFPNLGVNFRNVRDTMVEDYLLNPERQSRKLEACAQRFLGASPWKDEVTWSWRYPEGIPVDKAALYNSHDCGMTYALMEQLTLPKPLLDLEKNILVPAGYTLEAMTRKGIPIWQERVVALKKELERETLEAVQTMTEAAGVVCEPSRTANVSSTLYTVLRAPQKNVTPTGRPSTDSLAILTVRNSTDDPKVVAYCNALLKWRKASKKLNTFIPPLEGVARIHPSYSITNTVTGRTASFNPNFQQIPRDKAIRKLYGSPDVWLGQCDFSQIELRVGAAIAHEGRMIEAFNRGEDLHLLLARRIYEKKDISYEERTAAKITNFALFYGGEPETLRDIALKEYDVVWTMDECRRFHDAFHSMWNLSPWYSETARVLKSQGYIESLTGRRRSFSKIDAEALRQALNFQVQSAAADIALSALQRLHESPVASTLCGFVHDAVFFEVEGAYDAACATAQTISRIMGQKAYDFPVPITTSMEVGHSWGEFEEIRQK